MKLQIVTSIFILSLLIINGCKKSKSDDPVPQTPQEEQKTLLINNGLSWTLGTVTKDGLDVTDQFTSQTAVYEANPDHTAPPSTCNPILLSYLDVVIAGYASLMGDAGPAHFFETTKGWGPVLNNRADPLYPRAQPLADQTRAYVDDAIVALSLDVRPSV